jgi:hypothetical protein
LSEDGNLTAPLLERGDYANGATIQVDVWPAECEELALPEAGDNLSSVKGDQEPYRVLLPFRSATKYNLAPPVELPGIAISADGSDYLAEVVLTATSGVDALANAHRILADTFGAFAITKAGFVEVLVPRLQVQLVDPKPVLEGPVPPFDVVGGAVTEAGAALLDPTGEKRRARRIVNMQADAVVTKNNLDRERRWLTVRDAWPAEVRRAVALIHAGEVAGDAGVAFVLAYSALEVLARPVVGLLPLKLPVSDERRGLVESVRDLLTKQPGLVENDVDRLINNLSMTHADSPIDRFTFAFNEAKVEMDAAELKWIWDQRGAYVHPGQFDNANEALGRREAFRTAVAALVGSRLDVLAQN